MVINRLAGAAIVLTVLCCARSTAAQDVRTSVVLGTPPALQLDVRYEDPVAIFARLQGTLVFPVWITARNVSGSPIALGVQDLRLTLGSAGGPTVQLRPIDAREAKQRLSEDARLHEILKRLTQSDWAPDPFDQGLASLDLRPAQSRSGYVFFLRPDGFQFNGFMTVATTQHSAEILPNELIRTAARTRSTEPGLVERFVKAASTLPGMSDLPNVVYGRPFANSYALLFGISTYNDEDRNLPGAAQDVERMKAYLTAQGFDRVVVLSDRAVTESALRQVQAHFNNQIGPEDRLLIYYAGHGQQSKNGDADLVLSSGARVPMERFMLWIRGVKVKHLLVLLDACYSGTVITGVRDVLAPLDRRTREKVFALAREGSRFVITAGDANQVAHEDVQKWGGGLFTSAVLRALRPAKGGGIVTTYDLYSRVKHYVVEEVQKNGLTAQMPRIRDLGFGGDGKNPPELSRGEFVFVGSS
jgi:hypothetical protein